MSVLPAAPGDPGRDLLEQPAVAVRVAEGGVREVRAPGQVKPGGLRLLLHLADVDASADEILPGGVDVLDRQVELLERPGLHRRDALAEVDRGLRAGRRHLHLPEVAEVDVDVEPPSQALVEAQCPIDVGDWDRHHLEPHVDRRELRHLRGTGGAYVGAVHVDLRRVDWPRQELVAATDPSRPCGPWSDPGPTARTPFQEPLHEVLEQPAGCRRDRRTQRARLLGTTFGRTALDLSSADIALPPLTAALALELAPVLGNLNAAGFVDTPLSASCPAMHWTPRARSSARGCPSDASWAPPMSRRSLSTA